jgi:Tol biopolymer transport system component
LPEGEYLLFDASSGFNLWARNATTDFALVKLDAAKDVLGIHDLGSVLSPDGRLLVYGSKAGLTMFDLASRETSMIPEGTGCRYPSFAPDGQHLAAVCYDEPDLLATIHIFDLSGKARSEIYVAVDQKEIGFLAWSPDGKMLAYQKWDVPTAPAHVDSLYLVNTVCFKDTKSCPQKIRLLASSRRSFYSSRVFWSPDSQNLLIADGKEMRAINLNTGTSTDFSQVNAPTTYTVDNINGYAWSPDNRYVAFTGSQSGVQSDGKWSQVPLNRVVPVNRNDPKSEMDRVSDPRDKSSVRDWFKLLEFKVGRKYTVTSIAADLALRDKPSLDGKILKPLQPKDTVTLIDGPVNADYCTWWKMKVGDVEGWAQGIKFWFDAAK